MSLPACYLTVSCLSEPNNICEDTRLKNSDSMVNMHDAECRADSTA